MRKLALTITSTTCVFSAFGVFSRWLQNMTAFEENGLYKSGSFWGVALMLLCIQRPPYSTVSRFISGKT